MNDALSIGIDFGTTNSAMAWFNPDTNQAGILLNAEGEPKTPSLVYYGKDGVVVGKPVEDLIDDSENYEEEERLEVARRVVRSIKRNLINPPVIPIPGREPVRPVEVAAEILKKLKRDAETEHFQEAVGYAIITCPAVLGSQERKVVFEAAALAGFSFSKLDRRGARRDPRPSHRSSKRGTGQDPSLSNYPALASGRTSLSMLSPTRSFSASRS